MMVWFVAGMLVGASLAIVAMKIWWKRSASKAVGFKPSTRPEPKTPTMFIQKTAKGETGKIARVRAVHIRERRNNNPER